MKKIVANMSLPSNFVPPRLCCLRKWSTFAGYGFNLHAEKGKPGQYIGKVDPNSPAELGGLLPKYFLIEVNGSNVEDLTHQKVVERIKERQDQVVMLVAHVDTYKYCKEHSIFINTDMPEVVKYITPEFQPEEDEMSQKDEVASRTEAVHAPLPAASHSTGQAHVQSYYHPHDQVDSEPPEEDAVILPHAVSVQNSAPPQPSTPPQKQAQPSPPLQQRPRTPSPPPPPPPQQQQQQQLRRAADPMPDTPPPLQSPAPIKAAAPPSPGATTLTHNGGSSSSSGGGGAGNSNDPIGNISLEEMRAKLGRNKRTQVKLISTSFSEKSHMFQAL